MNDNNTRMDSIKIATAQFEHKSGDKNYNLEVIESTLRNSRGAAGSVSGSVS